MKMKRIANNVALQTIGYVISGFTNVYIYFLECFYQTESSDVNLICDHFGIERSSAYNKKNRALDKLVTRLYGKD